MAAYSGNIGMVEMIKFSMVATEKQQKTMEEIVAQESWTEYKLLIEEVLKVKLM